MKSCLRNGEFDRSTGSNPLLSRPISVQGVVGLTIDRCITLQQQINKTKQQNYIQTFIHTITTKINAVSYNTVQGHPLMLEMVY